ncbi:MAG: tetratricopeptide repeat protein [Flavobacteriales bacterium]|jgi:tetratricopeptide (TPR) repeat protein
MKPIFLLLILVLCSTAGYTQQSARLESIRHIRDGDNHLRMGNWEYALVSYNLAVQADQAFADAWMKRATLHQMLGRERESQTDYRQAISLNPYATYIYDPRAAIGMLAGKPIRAMQGNPGDQLALYQSDQHVDLNIIQGHYDLALLQLDSLARAGMQKGYEHERIALVYLLLGDLPAARSYADSALLVSPGRAIAHDLLGLAAMQTGDCNAALIHFDRAIQADPTFYLPYFNRSGAHRCLGDKTRALEDLNAAISLSRDMGVAYFSRAMLRKEGGDTSGALDDYNQALDTDSLFTSALFNRAFTFKMMGNYNQALEDANRIIQLEPESPGHWNLKGNIHLLFGDYRSAVQAYDRAVALDPGYGEALFNRGLAHLMAYAPEQGCADLHYSQSAGYPRAGEYISWFCPD